MMADDVFETVAITYSQPETTAMMAMFAFYGIPAYAAGFNHLRVMAPLGVALGGVQVRVLAAAADEARELLREVATRPAVIRPRLFEPAIFNAAIVIVACFLGVPIPPTRAPATFLISPA